MIAFDTETHLIAPRQLAPKLVCATWANAETGLVERAIQLREDALIEMREALAGVTHLVAHYAAFDLCVFAANDPTLIPLIFTALEQGRIHCTKIRAKLIDLAQTGNLIWEISQDGVAKKRDYSLAGLLIRYFGVDRSYEKEAPDAWRLRYAELENVPLVDWPEEAKSYALKDASDCLRICEHQEQYVDFLKTEEVHVAADFALRLSTCRGMRIDPEMRERVREMLATELSSEKMQPLRDAGVLGPDKKIRTRATGLIRTEPGSIKMEVLREHVKLACAQEARRIVTTETGLVSTESSVLEDLRHIDPIIDLYLDRQDLQKLVTTEMPRMSGADVIHFPYDVLKKTGRTSSSADKMVPSANGQNLDPRARPCYIARPGYVLLSTDYSSIELVTLAQRLLELFGRSTLAEQLHAGVDPHAYLGAQIVQRLGEIDLGGNDQDENYENFLKLKTAQNGKGELFRYWRKFAKAPGLGLPGGMGAGTLVSYAKKRGVVMTLAVAEVVKEVWHSTYPEMRRYFDWISFHCADPVNPGMYAYTSPLGMLRSGCYWTDAANGYALQTPAAEGAKIALFNLQRCCFTGDLRGLAHLLVFVHDEFVLEVKEDAVKQVVPLVESIVREGMSCIVPDVPVRVESKLTRRWYKEAEPVIEKGELCLWEPTVPSSSSSTTPAQLVSGRA